MDRMLWFGCCVFIGVMSFVFLSWLCLLIFMFSCYSVVLIFLLSIFCIVRLSMVIGLGFSVIWRKRERFGVGVWMMGGRVVVFVIVGD